MYLYLRLLMIKGHVSYAVPVLLRALVFDAAALITLALVIGG